MIDQEQADAKVKSGWLRAWLAFDALAVNEDVVKAALGGLVTKLDEDTRYRVYKKEMLPAQKVDNPIKGIATAWSLVANVELVSRSMSDLVSLVLEYGPSAVELMEPSRLSMDAGQAQALLNQVADMMHKIAAAGIGGAMLVAGKGAGQA
jgi:hypothetical protein